MGCCLAYMNFLLFEPTADVDAMAVAHDTGDSVCDNSVGDGRDSHFPITALYSGNGYLPPVKRPPVDMKLYCK